MFFILVTSTEVTNESTSQEFYISYSIGTHSVNLIDGIPARDVVKPGFYSYFNYVYTPTNSSIIIKLTTLSGDPDIYISTKPRLKFPTSMKNDITSLSI